VRGQSERASQPAAGGGGRRGRLSVGGKESPARRPPSAPPPRRAFSPSPLVSPTPSHQLAHARFRHTWCLPSTAARESSDSDLDPVTAARSRHPSSSSSSSSSQRRRRRAPPPPSSSSSPVHRVKDGRPTRPADAGAGASLLQPLACAAILHLGLGCRRLLGPAKDAGNMHLARDPSRDPPPGPGNWPDRGRL
jgi:hypothetical protein